MLKVKLLIGPAILLVAMVAWTVPALAEFESNTGQSQGVINAFPASTTFESVEGGPPVKCESKNKAGEVVAKGGWQIQVKSTNQQGKFFYQAPALRGPHEQLKIEKWGVCTGPAGLPVTVSCNLQLESNGMSPGATSSVYAPGCSVKLGECTVNVQPDGNKELQGTKVENNGLDVRIETNTKSVTSKVQEPCESLNIFGKQKGGKYFTKAGQPLETENQKLVN